MRLPHALDAVIPREKLADYLLSSAHPTGRGKAWFFQRFGFRAQAWEVLAHALRRHASTQDVVKAERTPFGLRYTVEGPLQCPDGRKALVRSVWLTETGSTVPRFVTAYPLK